MNTCENELNVGQQAKSGGYLSSSSKTQNTKEIKVLFMRSQEGLQTLTWEKISPTDWITQMQRQVNATPISNAD